MTRPGYSPIDDDTERRVARLVQLHVETHPARIAESTGLTPGYVRKIWTRLGIAEMASVGDVLTLSSPAFPSYDRASLPAVYENACRALSECFAIDECKDWADKAAALASYAKQAHDTTLYQLALRIQARAVRRAGELLKQIPAVPGARTDLMPVPTRGEAATEAGLSDRQRNTALRIANIPASDFHEAVGADRPMTLTQLALRGTASKSIVRASTGLRAVQGWARFCQGNDPIELGHTCVFAEVEALRQAVAVIDSWLDRIVTHLPVHAEVA